MTVLWLTLAAAAGFAAGHYRLPARAFERAYDWSQDGRWYSEPVGFLMLAFGMLLTPRHIIRGIHTRHQTEQRQPAPEMDPNWGRG